MLAAIVLGEALARFNAFGLDGILHPLLFSPGSMMDAGLIEPDEYVGKRLRRDTSTYFKGAPVNVNQWGWRGQDMDLEKKPGTLRIASLGASITLGSGVADQETYSHQLGVILSRELGRDVEVINMGVGAYSPYQIMRQYKKYGSQFKPDIVLAAASPHEFTRKLARKRRVNWDRRSALPIYGYLLRHSMLAIAMREFYNFHTVRFAIRDNWKKRNQGKKRQRLDREGYSYLDMSRDLARVAEKSGVPFILFTIRQINLAPAHKPAPPDHRLRRIVERIAQQTPNLYLIDIYDKFGREYTSADRIYPGDQHPNGATHRRYAEILAEELKPHLRNLLP